NGETLWELPMKSAEHVPRIVTVDMKSTPFHTITFLADNKAYEIDYAGKLKWACPPYTNRGYPGAGFQYHHNFTRLQNGNYMLLSADLIKKQQRGQEHARAQPDEGIDFGSIVEFDPAGGV